jgi:hypothetical protein
MSCLKPVFDFCYRLSEFRKFISIPSGRGCQIIIYKIKKKISRGEKDRDWGGEVDQEATGVFR